MLVTLTDRGRDLLESHRTPDTSRGRRSIREMRVRGN
jgi:hypothetical protein